MANNQRKFKFLTKLTKQRLTKQKFGSDWFGCAEIYFKNKSNYNKI